MKKSKLLYASMSRTEKILGSIWLVIQLFLPELMGLLNGLMTDPLGTATLNFITYTVNFLFVCGIFHRFLTDSLVAAWRDLWNLVQAVILGFVFYWACIWAFDWVLSLLLPSYSGLTDAAISALSGCNVYLRVIGVVLLSPVIEETLYRGLIFRNLWRKSRAAAYIVSILVFSAIHTLGYLGTGDITAMVICFLRYLPAGLILAWTYSKADNICAPILVHAAVNAIHLGLF